MQFAEGLTDRQAAEAVAARIDWKYALELALGDPGFDHSILADFRERVIAGGAEQQLLDDMRFALMRRLVAAAPAERPVRSRLTGHGY